MINFRSIIILVTLMLWSVNWGLHQIGNSDIFWQLKIGELIIKLRNIPQWDLFTYTAFGKPWINFEWLSSVFFSQINRLGGPIALSFLSLALIFCISLALFHLFEKISRSHFLALVGTLVVLYIAGNRLEVLRPHLFGYLFFSLSLGLLLLPRPTKLKLLGVLVIQLFWVNMHSSAILGLGIGFMWMFQTLLANSSEESRASKIEAFIFGMLLLGICFISPFTYQFFTYPFEHLGHTITMSLISDWQPLYLSFQFRLFGTWIYFALVLVTLGLTFNKWSWRELPFILLNVALIYLAIKHQRFVFYSASVLATAIFLKLKPRDEIVPGGELKAIPLMVMLFLPLVWAHNGWLQGVQSKQNSDGYQIILGRPVSLGWDHSLFPVETVQRLKDEVQRGKIFNDMEYGSYITYHLWPRYQTFIDTRTPLFGDKFIYDYIKLSNNPLVMEKLFGLLKVDTLLLSHDHLRRNPKLAQWLSSNPNWSEIKSDDKAILYFKKDAVPPVIPETEE